MNDLIGYSMHTGLSVKEISEKFKIHYQRCRKILLDERGLLNHEQELLDKVKELEWLIDKGVPDSLIIKYELSKLLGE